MQNITLGTTGSATNNRIATVNGVAYSYDAAGDVTSDGVHTYQYDCEGRIAKVDPGTANEADYFYDLNNWRVKKITGVGGPSPVTTYYGWDGGRVIAEYSTSTPTGNGVRYYHPDRLSTRMITDPNGNVIGTEDVLPFGEDAGTGSGVTEKHRFTTYERDTESGTDYGMNRQYSLSAGRFHQPDAIGGGLGNPQSLNRYPYTLADPINLFDPLGLDDDHIDLELSGLDDSELAEGPIAVSYEVTITATQDPIEQPVKELPTNQLDFQVLPVAFFMTVQAKPGDISPTAQLNSAIWGARELLEANGGKNRCMDLFRTGKTKDPVGWFGDYAHKGHFKYGTPKGTTAAAETTGSVLTDLNWVYPNTVIRQSYFLGDKHLEEEAQGHGWSIHANDMRVLSILHELSHALNLPRSHHAETPKGSWEWDSIIYWRCFRGYAV